MNAAFPPALLPWARTRILKRAEDSGTLVFSPTAYVQESLPKFLQILRDEITIYIEESVFAYISNRFRTNPNEIVPDSDTINFVWGLLKENYLTKYSSTKMISSSIRNVGIRNGWVFPGQNQ